MAASPSRIAFEVLRNGRRLCVSGLDGKPGVLSAILSWVDRPEDGVRLHVGGLDSEAREHLSWTDTNLRVGDEITVRIAEALKPTRIRKRTHDAYDRPKEEKKYLRMLAKKYSYRLVKQT